MKKLLLSICVTAVVIAVGKAHAQKPAELVEFRFRAEYITEDFEERIGKGVKLFPISHKTLEGSECYRVEKIDRGHENHKKEQLVITCVPEKKIFDQVTMAYWDTLTADSLNDLTMRVQATTSVACSAKKCLNNAHYGAQPCSYKNIPPYGYLCVHTLYPNLSHVCSEI